MLNNSFNIYPELFTERLVLRQMKRTDANEIRLLRSDESVNEFIGRSGTISIDEAKEFIDKIEKSLNKKESFYWAITLKGSDKLIGTSCLYNLSFDKELAELGYELLPAFQGKGIMQESVSAIIQFAFEKLNVKILTALPEAGNKRSISLLLKNNFLPDKDFIHVSNEEADGLLVYYLAALTEKT